MDDRRRVGRTSGHGDGGGTGMRHSRKWFVMAGDSMRRLLGSGVRFRGRSEMKKSFAAPGLRPHAIGLGIVLAVLVVAGASAATKPAMKVAVSPSSTRAGGTGNAFTFKLTATSSLSGTFSLFVPAGWTQPQA